MRNLHKEAQKKKHAATSQLATAEDATRRRPQFVQPSGNGAASMHMRRQPKGLRIGAGPQGPFK